MRKFQSYWIPICVFIAIISCTSNKISHNSDSPKIQKIIETSPYFSDSNKNREIALRDFIQTISFYNKEGEISEKHHYSLKDGIFVLFSKELIGFDKNGKPEKGNIYDMDGNLLEYWISTTDEKSNSTEVKTFNEKQIVIKTQKISYDENGNKIEKTVYNSNSSQFSTELKYNDKNQLTEYLNHSTSGTAKRIFNYDENGNQIEQIHTKSDGEIITLKFGYDDKNNQISTKSFDPQGNLKNEICMNMISINTEIG